MIEHISTIISGIVLLIAILTFVRAGKKDSTFETKEQTENNIKINMKLDELCRNTTDIKAEMKANDKRVSEIHEKQILSDDSLRRAWCEIDNINEKLRFINK